MFRLLAGGRTASAVAVAAMASAVSSPSWSSGSSGGTLADGDRLARAEVVANARPTPALTPVDFRAFKLSAKEQLTHDTARYTFSLPRENDELGLTVASCLVVRTEVDGA